MAENSSTELLLGLCLHYDVGVWPCSVKPLECVSTPTPAKSGSAGAVETPRPCVKQLACWEQKR